MASEALHVPREKLKPETLQLHYAIASLMEELEAIDWYRQRVDDTDDPALKAILLHNSREETEHAAMLIEWIRRHDARFDKELRKYLFTGRPIAELEKEVTGQADD